LKQLILGYSINFVNKNNQQQTQINTQNKKIQELEQQIQELKELIQNK